LDIQILVVEDDEHIRTMVKRFLQKAGYSVDECGDGDEAMERLYSKNYSLIILDIMLPGTNGQEILKELRRSQDTPVLMITALGDDRNQLMAFSNETDDYVIKPFSMPVLVKRSEALLRRSGVLRKEIRCGKLTLYPESYKAEYAGETIFLTPKEYEILSLFAQNKGRIIPHETLLTRIWGYDFSGNEGIVHASIKKLRDKLPANVIRTVKGVGYSLEDGNNEE
jgi:two-component system, OmpR family, response regulator VanR